MLTRRYLIIFTVFLLLISAVARATVVKDLYSANIPVTNQSSEQRASAIKQAFFAVIVKVTGNSQVVTQPGVQTAADSAENYVQQYSFVANDDLIDKAQHPYILQVDFTPNVVNSLLLRENIPVWGKDRPLTLFWVSQTDAGKSSLIGANSTNPVANLIDNDTDQRGVPAILPLLDLTDLNAVSVSDIQAPFLQVLKTAANRYGGNAMVILRITNNSNSITTKWTLVINDQPQNWQIKGSDIKDVINQGINQVADALAGQFAIANQGQQSTIVVQVVGLNSLNAFAKARDYLQSLAPVKSVSIAQLSTDSVTFQVQLVGSLADLQKVITLDHTLKTVASVPDNSGQLPLPAATSLTYQWNR
jgi:hypothetical protein